MAERPTGTSAETIRPPRILLSSGDQASQGGFHLKSIAEISTAQKTREHIIRHNVVTSQKGYMGGRKIILIDNMLYSIQNVERIPNWMARGAKICMFVRICLLRCFELQTIVSLSNIAFSSKTVVLSASGDKYTQI